MKFTLKIDKEREEEIVLYLHERRILADKIEELISDMQMELVGYRENEIVKLDLSDVISFSVFGGKTFAATDKGKYVIKKRLYELEDMLGADFVKINQSVIANTKKIERFETTPHATLCVVFNNGIRDYVSRRQLKAVKERMGIK